MRADYKQRREAGLCVRCGEPVSGGRARCAICAEEHRADNAAKRVRAVPVTTRVSHPGTCTRCLTPTRERNRFRGEWLCNACLNPDIPTERAESVHVCALGWIDG